MSKEVWMIFDRIAWSFAFFSMAYGGMRGFGAQPRFMFWLGAVSLVVSLIMLGTHIGSAASK